MLFEENAIEKPSYPKGALFIIVNEFCERFSFYGMKTVLMIYLTNSLQYDLTTSIMWFHMFVTLCYLSPMFGAMIADSFLGKYRTILYVSLVYAFGNVVLSIGAIPTLPIPHAATSLLGLLFVAIGTGGIKPCVSAFGGDQFVLPHQAAQLKQFFSIFYFSINAGAMLSTVVTPILRSDVKCFGQDSCFPLAFGVPAIIMGLTLIIFVLGTPLYRMKQPKENIITMFVKCIFHALRNKITGKNSCKNRSNWLEYADDKFTDRQISDFQSVLNVLYLFMAVPFYHALSDQQGSRWTYQAAQMDGRILGFTIKPDQIHVLNPALILILIPLFECYIYPILKRVGLKRPLQKLVVGGWLAVVAFIISALVEYKVQDSYGVVPANGEAQLRIFNSLGCDVSLNPPIQNKSTISALSALEFLHIPTTGWNKYSTNLSVDSNCLKLNDEKIELEYQERQALSYFITRTNGDIQVSLPNGPDNIVKDQNGKAKIRIFLGSLLGNKHNMVLENVRNLKENPVLREGIGNNNQSDFFSIPPGKYNLTLDSQTIISNMDINPGQIDTIVIREGSPFREAIVNMVPANSVHMLWQLPQLVVFTLSEILFVITGLEFSFTQAPPSMKSILTAAWLLTTATGNLIVVIISRMNLFESQVHDFLLYAGLMTIDMVILMYLCMKYKYVHVTNNPEKSSDSQYSIDEQSLSRVTNPSTIND